MTLELSTLVAILAMAAATILTRVSGLFLIERVKLSGRARQALEAIPPAVLMAVVAPTALMTGMANRIGTLDDAQAWAAEIAGFAPLSLRHSKRVLNDDGAYDTVRGEHTRMFNKAWASPDVIEAQVARFEKRPPRF